MTGFKNIPLPQRLGIKPGFTMCVINGPAEYIHTIGAMITQVRLVQGIEPDADLIHVFVQQKSDLEKSFPKLKKILGKPHALWVSWPKKSSNLVSDLNENIVREIGLKNGLVDVKVTAIDQTWSGLKFVYRLKDR
jgi:hypothetical protein